MIKITNISVGTVLHVLKFELSNDFLQGLSEFLNAHVAFT